MKTAKIKKLTDNWQLAGIINAEQSEKILAYEKSRASGRSLAAFTIIAGVLILVGIILFVAANWGEITNELKLTMLLSLLAATFLGAMRAELSNLHAAWIESLWLAATAVPLMCLALISQMFHVHGEVYKLFAAWCVLIAPIPFLTKSLSPWVMLIVAALSLLISWVSDTFRVFDFGEHVFFGIFILFGAALAAVSRLWFISGDLRRYAVSRYFGLLIFLIASYCLGIVSDYWQFVWLVLFVVCGSLIHFSFKNEWQNEVNAAFFIIFLIIFGTFLRLVNSMMNTGLLFIAGGILLLVCIWALHRIKKHLAGIYQKKES